MNALLPEAEFYRRVAFYRYHPEFDVNEREYKIRLASNLRTAREQLDLNGSRALEEKELGLRPAIFAICIRLPGAGES
ncbi:MAG: hypothetical protein ACXWID_02415 [Pyrinomonadaceae bacterium]